MVAQGIARVEQARGGGADERAADLVFALDGSPQVCTSTLPNFEGLLHLIWGLGLGFRVEDSGQCRGPVAPDGPPLNRRRCCAACLHADPRPRGPWRQRPTQLSQLRARSHDLVSSPARAPLEAASHFRLRGNERTSAEAVSMTCAARDRPASVCARCWTRRLAGCVLRARSQRLTGKTNTPPWCT